MALGGVLIVAAVVFAVCYLVDKLFTKTFRGKKQHKSGKAVRVHKRYGSLGLVIAVLGLGTVLSAMNQNWFLFAGGCFLLVVGSCLVVYYMTFGIFYDDTGFVLTTFGRKSKVYQYADITSQALYRAYNNLVIELYMVDGRSVQLQAGMEGVYPFLDHAAEIWKKDLNSDQCGYYDPANSKWFPNREEV